MSAQTSSNYPEGSALQGSIQARNRVGGFWQTLFFLATCIGIICLGALLYNVLDRTYGLVAYEFKTAPAEVSDRPLEELSKDELIAILQDNISKNAFNTLEKEESFANRSQVEVYGLVQERVLRMSVVETFSLTESLLQRGEIDAQYSDDPDILLVTRSWVSPSFVTTPMASNAEFAGVRTAVLGSLWLVGITMLIALPIGVGAAIYLQEYAQKSWINGIIQTNINNLAGVPSIIYGMLGLAIFVRTLEAITSGAAFGVTDSNGRTILSAGLTMALLILPLIIINSQEAIKAVPDSLRQASYGIGATKWQTIWSHVLPNALPGILTGSILAVSRAIGETAPLIVVGASTFITIDPEGPFSKFTALPIQIYTWVSRPQDEFRNVAAAAIVVLLAMLLTLNAVAILLRNRFSRRLY